MRRADRLFQLVQLLRGGRVVTAAALAEAVEVSERTIYRDVADLVRSGVPIEGEPGVGYALPRGFDLPPLMFGEEELEALVLGVRMVETWGGPTLARRARSVLSKIETVLPGRLRAGLDGIGLYAPGFHLPEGVLAHLEPVRAALSARKKLRLTYVRADGERSERVLAPLALYYWGPSWTLVAWCELRSDFRTFRTDRIEAVEPLDEPVSTAPEQSLEAFLARMSAECGAECDAGLASRDRAR